MPTGFPTIEAGEMIFGTVKLTLGADDVGPHKTTPALHVASIGALNVLFEARLKGTARITAADRPINVLSVSTSRRTIPLW